MKHPPPTLEELRQAFDSERIAHRAWPSTFEAAMADPLTAGVLGLIARRRALYAGLAGPRRHSFETAGPEPLPTVTRPPVRGFQGRRALDFKSRAAGERDDD